MRNLDRHAITAILTGAGGAFLLTADITANGIAFLAAAILLGIAAWRVLKRFW
jgi:hypothetical protein